MRGADMRSVLRHIAIWVLTAGLAASLGSGAAAGQGRLDPARKDKLKALAAETRQETERARAELRRARADLMEIYGQYRLDEKKAKSAQQRISKAQLALLNLHLDSQLRMRHTMSADQFARLSQMFERKRPAGESSRPHHIEGLGPEWLPDSRIIKSLELSPDQAKRLKSVFGPSPDRRKVMSRLESDSRQMIELYRRYDLDAAAARKLIESMHASQQDLASLNLRSQQALRSVLTQEQFQIYSNAIAQKMKQMYDRGKPGERGPRRF